MINTYRLYSLALGCDITVSYEDGKLKAFEAEAPDFNIEDSKQHRYTLFYTEREFVEAASKHKVTMTVVKLDITFAMFWEKYAHKIGKVEAEKSWNKLSKKDQQEAFNYISAYESFRKNASHSKLLPASYLNNKRWVK